MTDTAQPKRRRGCLFYGCLVGVVGMVIVLVAFLVGAHYARKMITEYTDSKPASLPVTDISPAQVRQTQQRIESFQQAIKTGGGAQPLELSADEINGLVQNSPELSALKGKVYLAALQDGRVQAEVSVPMDQLGLPFFRGRYLNGAITLEVSLRDGALRVSPREAVVKGKPLPGIYLDTLRRQNLAAQANQDAGVAALLGKLQAIQVKDGKLILLPKP